MNNTSRHKAYEIIKNKIVTFEIKPGDVLRESGISEQLGLGRTPVREALLMLEQEKLVECRSNVGYLVRKLTRKEAEDYFALRLALEEFAAPLIIERITPAAIKELEKVLLKAEQCGKDNDVSGVAACNTEFHSILYKATDSEAFVDLIFQTIDKIRWLLAVAVTAKGGPGESLEDHRRMMKTIKKRDAEELKKEIRIHLQHAQEQYLAIAAMLF